MFSKRVVDWEVIEMLLCASDLARAGYHYALSAAAQSLSDGWGRVAIYARHETLGVARHAFDWCGDLLADALLEAAYRVAEGRGVGIAYDGAEIAEIAGIARVARMYRRAAKRVDPAGQRKHPDLDKRSRAGLRVSAEFHRRLERAGIEVEQ